MRNMTVRIQWDWHTRLDIAGNHGGQGVWVTDSGVTETDTGTRTRFSRMTVTLYKVSDGNMQTEEVPASSF
jgi:hypothetical protein